MYFPIAVDTNVPKAETSLNKVKQSLQK